MSKNKVTVYSIGLLYCSVCAPKEMEIDEIEAKVNFAYPTGTFHPWSLDEKGEFADGLPNPCECNDDSSRMHYLLSC